MCHATESKTSSAHAAHQLSMKRAFEPSTHFTVHQVRCPWRHARAECKSPACRRRRFTASSPCCHRQDCGGGDAPSAAGPVTTLSPPRRLRAAPARQPPVLRGVHPGRAPTQPRPGPDQGPTRAQLEMTTDQGDGCGTRL